MAQKVVVLHVSTCRDGDPPPSNEAWEVFGRGFGHEWRGRDRYPGLARGIGLEKYAAVFAEHEITLEMLADLTAPDIDRLALPTGPRRQLIVAIQALRGGARAEPSAQAPETPVAQRPGLKALSGAS